MGTVNEPEKTTCSSVIDILNFIVHDLDETVVEQLVRHAESCDTCRHAISELGVWLHIHDQRLIAIARTLDQADSSKTTKSLLMYSDELEAARPVVKPSMTTPPSPDRDPKKE